VTLFLIGLVPGCGDSGGAESARGAATEAVPAPRASSPAPEGRGYEIHPLPPESLRLTGSAGSRAELLETIERGIAERDTARLFDLMITMREYETIVYPTLPVAHPPFGASFETVWATHFGDAWRGLHDVVRKYGGREVRIHALRFEKPDQDFVNYVLHETSEVDITVDGLPLIGARLFGSVVQVGDQWKVLSYPDL